MDTTWAYSVTSEYTTTAQNIRSFVSSGVRTRWEAIHMRAISDRFVRFIRARTRTSYDSSQTASTRDKCDRRHVQTIIGVEGTRPSRLHHECMHYEP